MIGKGNFIKIISWWLQKPQPFKLSEKIRMK
jgi:hypothetical protein